MKRFIYSLLCTLGIFAIIFVIFWLLTMLPIKAIAILCYSIIAIFLFCVFYFNAFDE